jgi:lambda family phage tail tape measure protein
MATPTIAELQVNINARPITEGTKALNDFADAANRVKQNTDKLNQNGGAAGGIAPEQDTRKVNNLSEAIDAQTRKLNQLAQQRQKLEASGIKSTQPQEYERLNRIIDANIAKVNMQGDAVERLERAQKRDADQKATRANQELRIQERLAEATVRQENVVTNAAARQQRSIEQTINGLSRQIKAQNEYNRTIEKLNQARDIGATAGTSGTGGITNAEYESYVKLAQAQRDATFAVQDNSNAIAQAKSKLDTYIATLSRADRAEVQYSRAVATLTDNLEKGNITQQQYNQRIEQFAARRDQLVAAANSNAAAEERYARQLQQVLGAYDPVIRATQEYKNAVAILDQGLENNLITQKQYTTALNAQRDALDKVKAANSGFNNVGSEYEQALNGAIRYRTELQNLAAAQEKLDNGRRAGLVNTPAQKREYEEATAAIKQNREEIEKRIEAGKRNSITIGQEKAALRGLPAQFTDIVVSLQGGQAPLTVLLQQGGQIKDQFGGVAEAFRGVGRGLMAIITPLNVTLGAFAALAIGAYQGSNEINEFNKSITQSRNAVGLSAGEFASLRGELESTGATSARAAQALTLIAANSNIAAGGVSEVAEAALYLQRATGQALDKTIDDFASLGKEPVEAAVRLDAQYKFLTASVLAQAQALVTQGKEQEAVLLLQGELSTAVTESSQKIIDDAGYVERAWIAVKDSVVGVFDAIRNIGRDATPTDELTDLLEKNAEISRLNRGNEAANQRDSRYVENENRIRQLRIVVEQEKQLADQQAANERKRIESVSAQAAAQRRYVSNLDGVKKAENDVLEVQRENDRIRAAGNVSAEQEIILKANLARAEEKVAEAKEKANKPKRPGALDTSDLTDVKSNLSLINAEYDGYYKRITALGEANVVSAEATYRSQVAILNAQKEAVTKSYDEQLAAINKLQGNKKNSAAQNISLANQETKAEDAKAKALEQIDAKLDVLQTKENGRIEERVRNIAAYKAALDSQLQNLVEQGERNADGVGRGDRQAAINQELGRIDRVYERNRRALADARADIGEEEFSAKLKDLEDNHTALKDQIIANDKEIQAANLDWTNGFMAALENAEDQALNFAGSTRSALEGAFNASGQALATFVTGGKINFKSFASSVIADMARIAAQQASAGILSSILRFGVTAAGAYFGGGANGLTPGSAGEVSSRLGASAAGYSSTYFQAKGGAWNGGTQYFANGGTFTNSVVNSPTAFGMSNGSRGIMGEAGPEAIVPLARTRNGDLGIRAEGFGGGGNATVVNVQVVVNEGSSQSTSDNPAYDQFGNNIGNFIRQEVYAVINTETRPGGSLQSQNA